MNFVLLLQMFWIFFKISLISFGGMFGLLPQLEQMLVADHHWITHQQFIQSYVMAQFVPGPNMVMCPMIGYQIAGWAGFVTAFFGIYLAPMILMGAAFALYTRYRSIAIVRRVELGLRPLVVGLLSASCGHLWWVQAHGLIGPSLWLSVSYAILLTGTGFYLLLVKKYDATKLIFSCGIITWVLHTLIAGYTIS